MTRAMMTLISRRAFLGGIGGAIAYSIVSWALSALLLPQK